MSDERVHKRTDLHGATGMSDTLIETAARAANLEAGRQRGLTFVDDWDTLTEQERGGWRLVARACLSVLHEAEEQGDGMCPDPECATDHICGDGGCRMNTLLADMGHERWVDAWREAADWRDQYRADREDGVELLKDILAWNFEAIPPALVVRLKNRVGELGDELRESRRLASDYPQGLTEGHMEALSRNDSRRELARGTATPGAREPILWATLIGGPLDGWPTVLSNKPTIRVTDLEALPDRKTAEYSLRRLADDGRTQIVARVHVETTTDEARLQLLLTHPQNGIQ